VPGAQGGEQRVHWRPLDEEQAQGRIVGLGPQLIARGEVVLGRRELGPQLRLVHGVQQTAHLGDPGAARVVVAGKGQPQQREAVGAQQQLAQARLGLVPHRCAHSMSS